ncbi:DUF2797 domain-containing protein [Methylophaga thiooxydans]|uniref:DUF2797 domain-containing protein n=1 Tax=Methylophaga thiooxydans DMS010 TaxID=637616 RepID=C0N5S5_9GAMM|nr:hypothetical protein MDMS009_1493 [Methylophaga thiooxydans DMS010]
MGKSVNKLSGQLTKMAVTLPAATEAQYDMRIGDQTMPMNALVGKTITLTYQGEINCLNCQRKTKKSYSGGFCFPCSQKLAQCDLCFMKPETCHYEQGTCREPEWGEAVCMQDHIVYLANSSGLKVGITRINQVPTRWIDQGATQARPIFRVKTRYQSGLVEVMFKNHVSDRTDWRKMLKGDAEPLDLTMVRDRLVAECADEIKTLQQQFGDDAIQFLPAEPVVTIRYPVEQYPSKVTSLNFDKTPEITAELQGIKGQYLIFDKGVINIRKFSGYQIEMVV